MARVEALRTDRWCDGEGLSRSRAHTLLGRAAHPVLQGKAGTCSHSQLQLDLLLCKELPHPNNAAPSAS